MNDEEKAAKIRALVRDSAREAQDRETRNQSINGNGNVQVGDNSNVTVLDRWELSPDNPALMPCPACTRPVSRLADFCPDCHDNLAYRRQLRYLEGVQRRSVKMALFFGGVAAAAWLVARFVPSISGWANVALGLALLGALASVKHL